MSQSDLKYTIFTSIMLLLLLWSIVSTCCHRYIYKLIKIALVGSDLWRPKQLFFCVLWEKVNFLLMIIVITNYMGKFDKCDNLERSTLFSDSLQAHSTCRDYKMRWDMFDIGWIIKIQICMNENIQMKEEDAESENFRRFDSGFLCCSCSLSLF